MTDITDSLTEFIQGNSDRKRQRGTVLSALYNYFWPFGRHSDYSIVSVSFGHKTQGIKLNDADSLIYV